MLDNYEKSGGIDLARFSESGSVHRSARKSVRHQSGTLTKELLGRLLPKNRIRGPILETAFGTKNCKTVVFNSALPDLFFRFL